MINNIFKFVLSSLIFTVCICSAAYSQEDFRGRKVMGWTEKVSISGKDLSLHARLDTGRSFSSLYTGSITKVTIQDQEVVKFKIRDRYGKSAEIEAPLVRTMRLRGSQGVRDSYVVQLGLCIGSTYLEDEISLSDISNSEQELVLGRQSLEGQIIVDPSISFTSKPEC
jgi:hypothetical protein